MNTARLFRVQPLRAAALRQPLVRPSLVQRARMFHNSRPAQPAIKSVPRQARPFHTSKRVMREKGDDHSAHYISQRIKSLKRIPPELIPLGVVIAFAIFAACFAMGKKLMTDKTLRLSKSQKSGH